ncbi:hypothetical protein BDP81DRAFT_325341, partial [Colletotrichum phormii]
KIRKVKCDETRPACRRCIIAGRTCDEYGIWASRDRSTTPFLSQQESFISLRNIRTSTIGLTDAEKRLFEWVSRRAIAKLAGVLDSSFWETIVLQTSSSEPAVMHAVLALSSVHKNQMTNTGSAPDQRPSCLDFQERCTLQHYNKSIVLQKRLTRDDPESVHVALICCILYICLEYMRKRFKAGHSHLSHGLKLLGPINNPGLKRGNRLDDIRSNIAPDSVARCLLDTFSHFLNQARSLKGPLGEERQSDEPRPSRQLPCSFESLIEARSHLDELLARAQKLRRCILAFASSSDVSHAFEMLVVQSCLRNDLVSWSRVYDSFKARRWTHLSARERLAFHLLPVYHTMAQIITEASLHPDGELIFDKFTWHFETMTASSKEILTAALPTMAADLSSGHCTAKFSFTADMGLIPPLYYVALKCRNRRIRRQAIELITDNLHQEGMWDAKLAAAVASEVMRMEEEAYYQKSPSTVQSLGAKSTVGDQPDLPVLPKDCRLLNVRLQLPDDSTGELSFSGTRRRLDSTLESFKKLYDLKARTWKVLEEAGGNGSN